MKIRKIKIYYKIIGRSSWKHQAFSKYIWEVGFYELFKKKHIETYFFKKYFKVSMMDSIKKRVTVFTRSSTIPYFFLNKVARIHNGKRWKALLIHRWNVGFRFGQFSRTRKRIKFETKSAKKKSAKKNKKAKRYTLFSKEASYEKIRLIKSGLLRTKPTPKKKAKYTPFSFKSVSA